MIVAVFVGCVAVVIAGLAAAIEHVVGQRLVSEMRTWSAHTPTSHPRLSLQRH